MKLLIKLEENPEVHIVNYIYNYLSPLNIYIPIVSKSTFKMEDYVYKHTYYGDNIVSVSGNIAGNKKVFYQNKYYPALKIVNDFKENVQNKPRKKAIHTKEELIMTLKKYNLNNLANLFTKDYKDLIISSIDEEIYTVREFMILSNYYNEVLDTIQMLIDVLNLDKGIIVTKNTNAKSIKNVKSIIGTYPKVKVILAPDKYLISYKPFLCNYLNKLEEDTLILRTSDIYDIYKTVIKGKYITENIIMISGDNIEKSLVINTKLGVSLRELIDKFITLKNPEYTIYLNGYLSGKKVKSIDEVVITKNIEYIVINKKEINNEEECINCGACNRICPVKINVLKSYNNNLINHRCIKCGLCNYVCPAKIKLKEIVSDDNES